MNKETELILNKLNASKRFGIFIRGCQNRNLPQKEIARHLQKMLEQDSANLNFDSVQTGDALKALLEHALFHVCCYQIIEEVKDKI